MNSKRGYYFPIVAYTLLLLLIWMLSWLISVGEYFVGLDSSVNSLVSAEGLRWALRTVLPSLNSVSWGSVILLLVSVGLLRSSGLLRLVVRIFGFRHLTRNERRAALFTTIALACYSLLRYMSIASPWNMLLGVTGDIAGSPFMHGLLLLLFLGVLLLSLVHGFIYGNFRSLSDVLCGVGDTFSLFIPALVALVPASGIMPCIEYTDVLSMTDISQSNISLAGNIILSLPFLHTILLHLIEKREE